MARSLAGPITTIAKLGGLAQINTTIVFSRAVALNRVNLSSRPYSGLHFVWAC